MLASETWLDAKRVALVGDGGTKKFVYTDTTDKNKITVPRNVNCLDGFNNAILSNCCLCGNVSTAVANITVYIEDEMIDIVLFDTFTGVTNCHATYYPPYGCGMSIGFCRCSNMYGCEATLYGGEEEYLKGFDMCTNIDSCNVVAIYSPNYVHGFINCSNLTNVSVSIDVGSTYMEPSIGLYLCDRVNNFKVYVNDNSGASAYGLVECTNISNGSVNVNSLTKGKYTYCIGKCKGISNTMTYTNFTDFKDCSYLNGCRRMDSTVTSTFLGGTNTHIDTATVEAS